MEPRDEREHQPVDAEHLRTEQSGKEDRRCEAERRTDDFGDEDDDGGLAGAHRYSKWNGDLTYQSVGPTILNQPMPVLASRCHFKYAGASFVIMPDQNNRGILKQAKLAVSAGVDTLRRDGPITFVVETAKFIKRGGEFDTYADTRTDNDSRWEMIEPYIDEDDKLALDIGCAEGYFTRKLGRKDCMQLGWIKERPLNLQSQNRLQSRIWNSSG